MKSKTVQKYLKFSFKKKNTKSNRKLIWDDAPDIKFRVDKLLDGLGIFWVIKENIFALRSKGTKSKAIARIWGLSSVWQKVLKIKPYYVIEVVSERFDKMSDKERDKVLLHEIAHIPKNFSGALIPHYKKGNNKFKDLVGKLVKKYMEI